MNNIEFLGSMGLLGIILLSGAACMFIWIGCVSWFEGKPRRFWLARLTYDDKQMQNMVRSFWVFGWFLTSLGALFVSINDTRMPLTFINVLAEMLYLITMVLVLVKAFMLLIIFAVFMVKLLKLLYHWVTAK